MRRNAPKPLAVHPANHLAVEVFIAASTQWVRSGMAGEMTGMNYAGVEALMRMMNIQPTRNLLDRIRIMEGAGLEVLRNKKT